MSARVAAAALFAAALAVYAGLASPWRSRALAAADEYRDARNERREISSRAAPLQRRQLALQRAAAAFAGSGGEQAAVRAVRRSVVTTLQGAAVRGVQLGVRPARAPAAAAVRLSAQGRFGDVVQLAGLLVKPGTGLVLERVRLSPRGDEVGLDLEAVGLESRP